MRRSWPCSMCITVSFEMRWRIWGAVKLNTRGTVSWRRSCRRRRQLNAQRGFSTSCPSTRKRTLSAPSRFESGQQQGSLSSSIRISSDRQFNWPRGSAPTHCRHKSWYRTWLPSCASAKDSHSRTLEKLSSKASTAQFELTLSHGARSRWRDLLPLGRDPTSTISLRTELTALTQYNLDKTTKIGALRNIFRQLKDFVCATPGESKAGAAVAIVVKDGAVVSETIGFHANA